MRNLILVALFVIAARRLGSSAAAKDVAQGTLRRVVETVRAGRTANPMALPAFVFWTARHIYLHRPRSARSEARAPGIAAIPEWGGAGLRAGLAIRRRAWCRRLYWVLLSLLAFSFVTVEQLNAQAASDGLFGARAEPARAATSTASSLVPLLGLDPVVGVEHDVDFFNRRLFLTFKYRTSDPTGNTCSDQDLDNVELVVSLPTQATFVEAREFDQVVAPSQQSGGTVTWSFGTVGRLAHCDPDTRGTDFVVTIDVDPSVPDDTPLQATASISTTTVGDDPNDNQVSVTFPALMFPLEVLVMSVELECVAGGQTESSTDGVLVGCSPGSSSSKATTTDPPGKLGDVTIEGEAVVKFGVMGMSGFSGHGTRANASVESTIQIQNPNPFRIPLRVHFDARFNCLVSDGTATAHPEVQNVITGEAECGFGNLDDMYERLYLHFLAEGGPEGVCRTLRDVNSTERGDETDDETAPTCVHQSVAPAVQTQSGTTPGTRELAFGLRMDEVEGDGFASANARARACISVDLIPPGSDANPCFFQPALLDVIAQSPVDLLITDESGDRVGRVDNPDLEAVNVAEIPGAYYSGPGSEPQVITLGLPDAGEYRLTVIGTGDGSYTLIVRAEDEDGLAVSEQSISGQASAGSTGEQSILLGVDGRVAFEPTLAVADVAADLLGAVGVLSEDEIRFLDLLGNGNGVFDVGDFRAFLVAGGELSGAALSQSTLLVYVRADDFGRHARRGAR